MEGRRQHDCSLDGEGDFDGNGRESHHSQQPEMQFLTIFSPQNMDCLKDAVFALVVRNKYMSITF